MYYTLIVPFATPAYDQTIRLRNEILREPLGLSFSVADLTKEYQHVHLACYDEEQKLVGCLVLIPLPDGQLKMRQVAVDRNRQKQGIGRLMVIASEAYGQENDFKQMILNARDTAIPFYEKLGYHKEGEPFEEVTIPHYKMIKQL